MAIAAPLVLCIPPASAKVTRKGVLEEEVADNFKTGTSATTYTLRSGGTSTAILPTRFSSASPGDEVKVSGSYEDGRLVGAVQGTTSQAETSGTSQGTEGGAPITAQTPVEQGARKVAVLLIKFPGDPAVPWDPEETRAKVFTGADSANAFYQEESYGQISLTGKLHSDGDVFGWFTIDTPTTDCPYLAWRSAADQAAATAGIDLSDYQHIIYVSTRPSSCTSNGIGQIGGNQVNIFGNLDAKTITHELGHNLGLQHAGSWICMSLSRGVHVQISKNCAVDTYGDPFDTMGNIATRHNSSWNLAKLGILSAQNIETVTTSGIYTIESALKPTSEPTTLRIPRTKDADGNVTSWYYLEIRQTGGVFENVTDASTSGVSIRATAAGSSPETLLIDCNPATSTFDDAPCATGESFQDGTALKVTTLAAGGGSATVSIEYPLPPDTEPPSAPTNLTATPTESDIRLTWGVSTDDVGVDHYDVYRDGTQIGTASTSYCALSPGDSIALVDKQGSVSAWTDTGSGYSRQLVVTDSSFNSGAPGLEGGGNLMGLKDFKAGELQASTVSSTALQLANLPVTETFDGSSASLASFANDFSKLGWVVGKGGDRTSGWGPITTFSNGSDGASHNTSLTDNGEGVATAVTLSEEPAILSRFFSLWLDMSSPASAKNGYELRFTWVSNHTYECTLSKWQSGSKTALGGGSTGFFDGTAGVRDHAYVVYAEDAAGNRSASSAPALTVRDTRSPTAPTNLTASSTASGVQLGWTASTDDVGVDYYDVYRDGSQIGTTPGAGFLDTTAAPGDHTYAVYAQDAAGNKSGASQPTLATVPDSDPPSAPANFTANATASGVQLSWNPSTDDVGVDYYDVYRDGSQIGTTPGAGFLDTTAAPGDHTYAVYAQDSADNRSDPSSPATVTVLDTESPTAPTALTADATASGVQLSWIASTDDVGVDHYVIFRDGSQIATAPDAGFLDTTAALGEHTYAVYAQDAAGNQSDASSPTIATVLDIAPPTVPPSGSGQPTDGGGEIEGESKAPAPRRPRPRLRWHRGRGGRLAFQIDATRDPAVVEVGLWIDGRRLHVQSGSSLRVIWSPRGSGFCHRRLRVVARAFDSGGSEKIKVAYVRLPESRGVRGCHRDSRLLKSDARWFLVSF